MKNISLIIFTLFLTSLQAFAQEKTESEEQKAVEEQTTSETTEEIAGEKPNLNDKLAELEPKKIRIYEFNPVKNPKGVVTIVEFNDLSCKPCLVKSKEFYDALNAEDLKDVKLIYKHINNDDTKLVNQETVYGLIANKTSKFWDYKAEITNNNYTTNEDFISAMMTVGVSKTELYDNLMLSSESLYKKIDADNQFAQSLKSKVAPMFFIDGYKLGEDLTTEEVNEYISLKVQEFKEAQEKENNKYKMGKF